MVTEMSSDVLLDVAAALGAVAFTNSRETPGTAPVEPPCSPETRDDLPSGESMLAHPTHPRSSGAVSNERDRWGTAWEVTNSRTNERTVELSRLAP
jgi:hypothetical protein